MSCAMQVLAYKFLDPQLLWFSFTRGSKKHGIVCDIKKLASFRGGFASEASKTTPGGGPKGRRKLGNEVSKM